MKTRMAGFTLIEVLITVIIVGVLAAIAIPSYTQYTVRAARNQAETTMLNLSQMEERFFSNNYAYYPVTAVPPAADLNGWSNFSGSSMANRKYNISVALDGTTGFTITAVPFAPFVDAQCGTLTLNNVGTKGSSLGSPASCW